LLTAKGKEAGGTTRLHEQFSYGYDAAWNLSKRTNNALVQAFNVNNLNALTTATNSGTLTVAGTTTSAATNVTVNSQVATLYLDNTFAKSGFTVTNGNNAYTAIAQDSLGRKDTNSITFSLSTSNNFTYDSNGNLTSDGTRGLEYDDENQLTRVTVTNQWKSEFAYDGFLRRRIRSEYKWSGGTWLKTNEVRYVYDGKLPIQERDANNLATVSYTRGNDLGGSLQNAGGIGGLLAFSQHSTISPQHSYYHSDGNGNVTTLINTQQVAVARYTYDPYGNLLSKSGPLADANLYRFSSKEYHQNSGLVYYLYRYYEPNLQRWLNRDRIEEEGGINLYEFGWNSPLNYADTDGRVPLETVLDAASICSSAYDLWNQPSWGNFGFLAWDVAATCVPYAPGSYVAKACKAKRGPKPGLDGPHNQMIKETADKLEAEGNKILAGGKRPNKPEAVIATPGGKKESRRPDILYEKPSGEKRAVQVGKRKADGTPVKREVEAQADLEKCADIPTDFLPYN
jgi:RHS repeat-associated protein